jgi:putative hemolysin
MVLRLNKIMFLGLILIIFSACDKVENTANETLRCVSDSDCVPAECCHPVSCVNHNFQTNCAERFCTMECRPGTLDCGQGSCGCVDGICSVTPGKSRNTQIANPASVKCTNEGNKLEIRTDETGGQYGVCIFSDGSECEEWKHFRGEC